jgi:hypothetical protein
MKGLTDYLAIRRKVITDEMDKFPNIPNRTLARLLMRKYPTMFPREETTRSAVRYLRGASGDTHRNYLKDKTYAKPI